MCTRINFTSLNTNIIIVDFAGMEVEMPLDINEHVNYICDDIIMTQRLINVLTSNGYMGNFVVLSRLMSSYL